ncbi:MAG TPA: DNA methyltransferase [Chitinophagales bacterium]|mgnify:CR=1 FL=1|nr:DNA methyltransferase [Chitinophagales bacterium]
MYKNIEINKIYCEPCLDTVSRMPDNFLDCVITSPPYWQLRDYGYEGQWGLEPTYQEYLEHLWSLMDAVYPKLKDGGTVWINLGDSYSTQSGTNVALSKGLDVKHYTARLQNRGESGKLIKDKNLPNKCLLLIPHRFAIGCESPKWILRDDLTEEEKEYVIKEMINAKR